MAFICEECMNKYFENSYIGLCESYGPCEFCGVTKVCDDHPSKYLKRKVKQPTKKGKE